MIPVNGRERFLDVQLPPPALGIDAVPVEQAKRGVAGFLDLRHEDAAADSVDSARRQKDAVAWLRGELVQAVGYLATTERFSEPGYINAG